MGLHSGKLVYRIRQRSVGADLVAHIVEAFEHSAQIRYRAGSIEADRIQVFTRGLKRHPEIGGKARQEDYDLAGTVD